MCLLFTLANEVAVMVHMVHMVVLVPLVGYIRLEMYIPDSDLNSLMLLL